MIKNISNLGDAAIYCDFGSEVNRQVNHEVIKYFNTLKNKKIKGITNLAPSYNKLIITFDLEITNYKELIKKIHNLKLDEINESVSKKNFVPICIDEEFALDVDRVSKKTNLSFKEIYKNILNKEFYSWNAFFGRYR